MILPILRSLVVVGGRVGGSLAKYVPSIAAFSPLTRKLASRFMRFTGAAVATIGTAVVADAVLDSVLGASSSTTGAGGVNESKDEFGAIGGDSISMILAFDKDSVSRAANLVLTQTFLSESQFGLSMLAWKAIQRRLITNRSSAETAAKLLLYKLNPNLYNEKVSKSSYWSADSSKIGKWINWSTMGFLGGGDPTLETLIKDVSDEPLLMKLGAFAEYCRSFLFDQNMTEDDFDQDDPVQWIRLATVIADDIYADSLSVLTAEVGDDYPLTLHDDVERLRIVAISERRVANTYIDFSWTGRFKDNVLSTSDFRQRAEAIKKLQELIVEISLG